MSTAAVILAAGAGERLGRVAKALLRDERGRSFLEAIADTAREAGVGPAVVVVAEPFADAVAAEAARLGLASARNRHPERGMASSVALGFAYAEREFDAPGALLWPVDHPRVRGDTVRAVIARGAEDAIAVPMRGGRGGHPTWFGRRVWPELSACEREADGARGVVRARPSRVARFEVEDDGVIADVDTPADVT